MTHAPPQVSVVMPVYKGEEYVAQAIESILAQTFTNFEFIIVNDASPDNSAAVIAKYAQQDARIRVITNPTNLGQSPSANIGFRAARAPYIARMDQDDLAYPERLAQEVAFLDSHPDYLMIGTQAEIIDSTGKSVGVKRFPESYEQFLKTFGTFLPFCHPSIMVRKSLLDFSDRLWFEEGDPIPDTYTFLYYVSKRKMANLPDILMKYRVHEDNGSYQNIKAIFNQTIQHRIKAIRDWGFPWRWYFPVIWFFQALPVYLLPNMVVMNLFLIVRGIKPWSSLFSGA